MLSSTPDDILIDRILKGDKSCFRVVVERYQNLVFTIAFRITRNREEAEEVAQAPDVVADDARQARGARVRRAT